MGIKDTLNYLSVASLTFNQSMKRYTTVGIGGDAKYFSSPKSLLELNELVCACKDTGVNCKVIGAGSNLLFSDDGYDGLVVTTRALKDVFVKPNCVRAMAGVTISQLIDFCLSHGLGGVEGLIGIPATVGGAVVMNAGAFGHNVSDYIYQVEVLSNGKIKRYYKNECKFSYRKSRFLGAKEVIVAVDFQFPKGQKEVSACQVKKYQDVRRERQPTGRTFGSVFKNPKGLSAGALIEGAGLKGLRVGGATVSEKHANFIINQKNATAKDVCAIIEIVKRTVENKYKVDLELEAELIGSFNETYSRFSHTYDVQSRKG